MNPQKINVLVIGVGSIGERHVRNLLSLGATVSIFDTEIILKTEIAEKYAVQPLSSLDNTLKIFDLVLICTPTHTHVELAKKALNAGCHIFIEKPIAEKHSSELASLSQLAKMSEKIILVGCNMRFHRGVQEIKNILDSNALGKIYSVYAHCGHYLPNWRKTDYRNTYSARAAQGGGIMLECIHEFDYLRWLFGDILETSARTVRSGALDIDGEDSAEITFLFKSGFLGHLHADYLQQTKRRGCEIVGENGTFIWESRGKNPEIATFTFLRKNGEPIEQKTVSVELDEMYLAEMRYLLEMIENGTKTMNDVIQAAETLRLVELAKESASKQMNGLRR